MGWELEMPNGQVIRLAGSATIGRAPNNHIVVNDTLISRRHTELRCDGNVLVVIDLNSTNGTYLNEVPLRSPHQMQPGDVLRVGSTIMQLRWVGDETIVVNPQLSQTGQLGTQTGVSPPSPYRGEAIRRPLLPKPALILNAPEPRNPIKEFLEIISGDRDK